MLFEPLKTRSDAGLWVLGSIGLMAFGASYFFSELFALGFAVGGFAFSFAFIGLEKVASRVLKVGAVGRGSLSAFFWVLFKFIAPGGLLFYGVSRGFSGFGIVAGLTCGLLITAAVLWTRLGP